MNSVTACRVPLSKPVSNRLILVNCVQLLPWCPSYIALKFEWRSHAEISIWSTESFTDAFTGRYVFGVNHRRLKCMQLIGKMSGKD